MFSRIKKAFYEKIIQGLNEYNPSFRTLDAKFTKQNELRVITSEYTKGDFDSPEGGFKKVGIDIQDRLWSPRILLSTTIIANNRGMDAKKTAGFSVYMYVNDIEDTMHVQGEGADQILKCLTSGMSMNDAAYPLLMEDSRFLPFEDFYMRGALTRKEQQRANRYKDDLILDAMLSVLSVMEKVPREVVAGPRVYIVQSSKGRSGAQHLPQSNEHN